MPTARISKSSRDSAEVEPIVLRDNGRTRLVFRAKIVNNDHDRLQPVNGRLVWQKQGAAGAGSVWVDETHSPLTKMVAGSGFQLALSTHELFMLTQAVRGLYGKFWENGHVLPEDGEEFELRDTAQIAKQIDPAQSLDDLLRVVGESAFPQIVQLLIGAQSSEQRIKQLAELQPDDLADLGAVAGLSACREAVALWEDNRTEAREAFWQQSLSDRTFVLSQVFSAPVMVLGGKSYVGGKNAYNAGGKETDFLLRTAQTGYLLLIEIKTPMTPLLQKTAYRDGVYAASSDLVGAVAQIAVQRDKLIKDFHRLCFETEETTGEKLRLAEPRCLVIAGSTEQLAQPAEKDAFELFRAGQRQVDVIAFDELFGKVQCLVDLLGRSSPTPAPEGSENAP